MDTDVYYVVALSHDRAEGRSYQRGDVRTAMHTLIMVPVVLGGKPISWLSSRLPRSSSTFLDGGEERRGGEGRGGEGRGGEGRGGEGRGRG